MAGHLEVRVEHIERLSLLIEPRAREDKFALCARCGYAEDCTTSQLSTNAVLHQALPDAGARLSRRASDAMSDMARRASAAATGFEMKDVCSSLANCFRHLQRGDVVSWNEVLRLSVTPQDIAAAVHQEGREVLEVSLLAHGRDILAHGQASRLLASCDVPADQKRSDGPEARPRGA